jgi:hypothetical protein
VLSNRFNAFSLAYRELLRDAFTIPQVTLAFIAAMAKEALLDSNQVLTDDYFTDNTGPNNPVRIQKQANLSAPRAEIVRGNVMWALMQLPVDLFNSPSMWGLDFFCPTSRTECVAGDAR